MTKELSGAHWTRRFSGSQDTKDLSGTFRYAVEDFIAAMKAAGIRVSINATYRPIKRSYLMHCCWRIVNDGVDTSTIPPMAGLEIEWSHATASASMRAAGDMVAALSLFGDYVPNRLCALSIILDWRLTCQFRGEAWSRSRMRPAKSYKFKLGRVAE